MTMFCDIMSDLQLCDHMINGLKSEELLQQNKMKSTQSVGDLFFVWLFLWDVKVFFSKVCEKENL